MRERIVTARELIGLVWVRATAPLPLIICLAVSVVLALAGPFGTYDGMPLPMRFWYWALIVYTSLPLGYATRYVTALWLPRSQFPGIVLVPSALMTVAYTPILYLIVRGPGGASGAPVTLLAWLAGMVVIVALCVNFLRWTMGQTAGRDLGRVAASASGPPAPPIEAPATPPAAPRLVSRLGDLPCTDVLRLSGRDHYVDVATRHARTTLLLRLSDAMAEVEGIPGAQVHRSHWVARDAVIGARREGSRIVLDLVDGSTVPVSRGYRDRAAAAGLLKGLRPAEDLAAAE